MKINFNNYLLIAIIAGSVAFGRAEFQIKDLHNEQSKLEMSIKYLDQKVDGHDGMIGILNDRDKRNVATNIKN